MIKLIPIYSILMKNAPCFISNFKCTTVNTSKAINGIVAGYNLKELIRFPSKSASIER